MRKRDEDTLCSKSTAVLVPVWMGSITNRLEPSRQARVERVKAQLYAHDHMSDTMHCTPSVRLTSTRAEIWIFASAVQLQARLWAWIVYEGRGGVGIGI